MAHVNKCIQQIWTSTSQNGYSNFFAIVVCVFSFGIRPCIQQCRIFSALLFFARVNPNFRKHTNFLRVAFSSNLLNINTFHKEEKSIWVQRLISFDWHRKVSISRMKIYALIIIRNLYDRRNFCALGTLFNESENNDFFRVCCCQVINFRYFSFSWILKKFPFAIDFRSVLYLRIYCKRKWV